MKKFLRNVISLCTCGIMLASQGYTLIHADVDITDFERHDTYKCSDTIDCVLSQDGILTISGTGDIPEGSTRYYVTAVKQIVIEDGITSVGDECFKNFPNLESVTFGNDVKYIGDGAFESCSSLSSVTFSNSIQEIGDEAFASCTSLKELNLNDGLKVVGKDAFNGCIYVSEVEVPNSVTTIGDYAMGIAYQDDGTVYAVEGFTIYGYMGSQAESYVDRMNSLLEDSSNDGDVSSYGLSFVALDQEETSSAELEATTTTFAEEDTSIDTGDTIGSILLIGAMCGGLALATRKKRSKWQQK